MPEIFGPDIVSNGEQVVSLTSVHKLQEWARFVGLDPKNVHIGSRYPHIDLPAKLRHKPLKRCELVGKQELVLILIREGLAVESRQFGCEICLSDQEERWNE